MSYSGGQDGVPPRPAGEFAAPPRIPRAALDGVRTRRIIAVCLDFILVSTLSVGDFFWAVVPEFWHDGDIAAADFSARGVFL